MNLIWLISILFVCAIISLVLCAVARILFPKFRSGEHKPGVHRSDLQVGRREIKSIELPLVGGPAFMLAIAGTGIAAGYFFNFQREQWTLLLISLGAALGYTIVGFIDDWRKVYSNEGISERAKMSGVVLVSVAAAVLYFFLLPGSGQESYSPYKDFPILNALLCSNHTAQPVCPVVYGQIAYFGWLIFLMLMTGFIGSVTTLSVDFSDGLDGLAGGLVFSAALALGIVVTGILDPQHPNGIVLEVLALTCAGGILGYLPWNWPSSWAARRSTAKRRAKIIMGDSGALGLGGMLAMTAIFSRNELLLLMIGGAFVLEGASALLQSRVLTPFFRKNLQHLRFANSREFVPHTEFPLPFLATPLHCHFDLLGWDRRRLVYAAWALGACFAILGVVVSIVAYPWQRYLGRILVLILFVIIWSSGSWSKCYFVGKHPIENTRRSRLALFYGFPYKIMGLKLYHLVEVIEASDGVIETPAEEEALWQRISIFDARAMLGLYCYRAGYYPAALAQWSSIPDRNRVLRPEIERLLVEVDTRLALEKQETQPMRRDQITQQEPILSGNLSPADLPNPHEPIRNEEKIGDGRGDPWLPLAEDSENHRVTASLASEAQPILNNNNNSTLSARPGKEALPLGSLQPSSQRPNWLARLFRISPPN
ncbi:hypothetical protein EPA93_41925 [Ktedonosporobacter rubrisoli]|uniref:Phospho-N-acetylmuramoyl-pentapeptide-transferase n=1 Tax=Ktedonosporobacter rubrisoli TaxID=2509675 RepID=A0A4P6K2U2_KTERU|nr:hypothetical protein [Ktedonosporobacter rubrisoli]QBD82193.1 hypothetical protein EPA93_41925 [Ktedonosporobacter rubrisoli]